MTWQLVVLILGIVWAFTAMVVAQMIYAVKDRDGDK